MCIHFWGTPWISVNPSLNWMERKLQSVKIGGRTRVSLLQNNLQLTSLLLFHFLEWVSLDMLSLSPGLSGVWDWRGDSFSYLFTYPKQGSRLLMKECEHYFMRTECGMEYGLVQPSLEGFLKIQSAIRLYFIDEKNKGLKRVSKSHN